MLHESRSLISGSRHTGHRTWQGALHLATYLLANPRLVSGRRVLELGAGTGFLSILSRMFLGASCVTATDGEDRVVEAMRENLALNSLGGDDQIAACRLWWGSELEGDWRSRGAAKDIDVVLGADIVSSACCDRCPDRTSRRINTHFQIYQKEAARALVRTLRAFLDLQPRASILLSNALRFPDVFEVFRHDCGEYISFSYSASILNVQG